MYTYLMYVAFSHVVTERGMRCPNQGVGGGNDDSCGREEMIPLR